MKAKYKELLAQYLENYLTIYDVPLDVDLNNLDHCPFVWIRKEELIKKNLFFSNLIISSLNIIES